MGIRDGALSVKASINLYQALVVSILEYGSEIWGFDLWRDGEQVQYDMAKRILRCSASTSRPVLFGELGLMSLYGRRNLKKFAYWFPETKSDRDHLICFHTKNLKELLF